jgi:hypothetical protein
MNRGFLKRTEPARSRRVYWMAAGLVIALGMAACVLQAQEQTVNPSQVVNPSKMSTPAGYIGHYTVDMGGRISNQVGAGAMYDTLVNLQSGPRMNGVTIELRRPATNKGGFADIVHAMGSGFGGDPYNYAKLSASKGRYYEFNGIYRRDRQYFDYDLLGNPNLPSGITLPIGKVSAPTGYLAWPQPQHSSDMTNSVRRMYDTDLRLYPLAKISLRLGYSHNIFEGPSLLPVRSAAGYSYNSLMEQYQRHLTDEYTATLDWKPIRGTLITYEQRIHHYKDESYITLDPNGFLVQEADGTPAYLGNWDGATNASATPTTAWTPYSEGKSCNANSVISSTQFLYPSPTVGGRPIIDPACFVLTSYSRTEPTSINLPSETLRFQSTSIKNLVFNGQFSYSLGNMKVPNFFETGTGLWGTTREEFFAASATGKREVYSGDLGVIWQVTRNFDLADQVTLSANAQPGSITIPSYTKLTTATTAGSETVNSVNLTTTVVTTGAPPYSHAISSMGTQTTYFGNEQLVNNLTASWTVSPKLNMALTYRYGNRNIGLNTNITPSTLARTTFAISEQGVIFNAAYRVSKDWDLNGSIEALYDDNAFTTMSPRQVRHYRVHTKFRPAKWAIISAAYNDMERHNNTNNANLPNYGPLDHVDYSRTASISGMLTPNEHVAVNFDYAYGDVYTATNICFSNMNKDFVGLAGTAVLDSTGAASVCVTSSTTALWKARAFADAPTQHGSLGLLMTPTNKLKFGIGYQVSAVNGTQFFNDARAVNGSMHSTYQTPYVKIDWQARPSLIWKAEYNYSGYGEGGVSGAESCTTTFLTAANVSTIASTVKPCATISVQTGMNSTPAGMTAPRNFHANNILLGLHYEF